MAPQATFSRIKTAGSGLQQQALSENLDITPALMNRKGLLHLVAVEGVSQEAIARIQTAYYTSPLFDLGRCLAEALVEAYDEDQRLHILLPGALVVLGMDVYIVGTPGMVAWITRYEGVQRAFDTYKHIGLPVSLDERPSYTIDWEVAAAHWRLTAGDTLLVAVSGREVFDDDQVLRLAMRHDDAQRLANAAAELLRRHTPEPSGALICLAGGFSPVPSMSLEPPPRPQRAKPIDDGISRRRSISPIWVALLIAAAAILVTVQVAGRENVTSALRDYIELAFAPQPTPTPAPEPTATPQEARPSYLAAPRLVAPDEGTRLTGGDVRLAWDWYRPLAGDEAFDVRVARAGQTPVTLELTAERETAYVPVHTGWYEWTVAVVSGSEATSARQISEAADVGSFYWGAE